MKTIFEKSCGVVVFHEKNATREYLLLHYPSGHWDLPKGHVEKEETEHQTALRELEEETGISDVKLLDGYREVIRYTYQHAGQTYTKDVIYFLGKSDGREIKISHEHQNWQWLPYYEAVNLLTFENAKQLVVKAEKFLNK